MLRVSSGQKGEQRPATSGDAATVLKQMLRQGGISHGQDEGLQEHQSLSRLLETAARDMLGSDEGPQSGITRRASLDVSGRGREGQHKAQPCTSGACSSFKRKEEPTFAGTWKEWCQAEQGHNSSKPNRGGARGAATATRSMRAMETNGSIPQHAPVDIGADFRSTLFPAGTPLHCLRDNISLHFGNCTAGM